MGEADAEDLGDIKIDIPELEVDSEHFQSKIGLMTVGLVPNKTALRRETYDVSVLLLIGHSEFADLFEPGLQNKLLITCGGLLRENKDRKKMVSWVDDSRTTQLSEEQT